MDERPSRVGAADNGLVSRRTVNLGAAWSVPVVLAAVAAPAAQGSSPPPDQRSALFGGITAQKGTTVNGNREVTFTLSFAGVQGSNSVVITGISAGGPWTTSMPTPPATVDPTHTAAVFIIERTQNSSMQVTVSYSVNGVPATVTVNIV